MSEEPEVPDTHKALGQHMEKKSAQEFVERQPHEPFFVLVRRVPPTESDQTICQVHQAVVGNGHSVGVGAKVVQHMLSPAERAFAIDHPLGAEQPAQHRREGGRRLQVRERPVETEFSLAVEFAKTLHKLTSEYTAQDFDRQEEVCGRRNPAGVIRRQSTGRNDAVNMRMMQQLLIPRVQDTEEADLRAEMLRVAGNGQQRLGAGAK